MDDLKLTKNTYTARPADIKRRWCLVDADGQVLGRMASEVAGLLRGKHKVIYTPSIDTGDFVIIINADKVKLTGDKQQKKKYYHHSGYPGGLKEKKLEGELAQNPEKVVRRAVRGMLPKNRLGRAMLRKLHVYAGVDHPHGAQKPEPIELKG